MYNIQKFGVIMRVCDQFTDERIARFFPPTNHELEVHSSVDLTGAPAVVDLDVDLPMLVVRSEEHGPRAQNPMLPGIAVRIAQGEQIVGLQSYRSVVDDVEAAPRSIRTDDMGVFGDNLGADTESLEGITHAIIEFDWLQSSLPAHKLSETPFAEHGTLILPVSEPLPYIDDTFEEQTVFKVQGLINQKREMIPLQWGGAQAAGRWLVDLCVMNAYAHNRVESTLLRDAIGFEYSLLGLVSSSPTVAAYLRDFDEKKTYAPGITFKPTADPNSFDYDKRFPRLDKKERTVLDRLRDVAYIAMTTHDRSKLK